ncbi:MAG: ATP-dependent Clp protease adaptor ClpS [Marinifilaceae bacterium]
MNENTEERKVLFLYNDDVHTFDYVVRVLMDICDHDANQAEQCAYITHYRGKCDVRRGELDMMKLLRNELRKKGLKAAVE